MEIKCADCGCLPSECKISPSRGECPIAGGRNVVVVGTSCPTMIYDELNLIP
jgi:hypothetical protein